ncbi:hypothetical protein PtB15_1B649 [Puccinia triticina]|nr:hypothetical protein PtB15_1B649 [Puccinia triticina]
MNLKGNPYDIYTMHCTYGHMFLLLTVVSQSTQLGIMIAMSRKPLLQYKKSSRTYLSRGVACKVKIMK